MTQNKITQSAGLHTQLWKRNVAIEDHYKQSFLHVQRCRKPLNGHFNIWKPVCNPPSMINNRSETSTHLRLCLVRLSCVRTTLGTFAFTPNHTIEDILIGEYSIGFGNNGNLPSTKMKFISSRTSASKSGQIIILLDVSLFH